MNIPAVGENSEQLLRDTSAWETSQRPPRKLLEDRVRVVFETLMPGADVHAGYHCYVAANEAASAGGPSRYTNESKATCSSYLTGADA